MKHLSILIAIAILLLLTTACQPEEITIEPMLDAELIQQLQYHSGGIGEVFFQLPESNDFNRIPQDPRNPLTAEKVRLGQLLYHETGLALAPAKALGEGTYSCASCHFASAGFQAGRHQGIGEGGAGIGIHGEGREKATEYTETELDVQPIRTPTTLNTAYQELMLWNGQFGAGGMNAGTEFAWKPGTPIESNMLGFQGLETQAIAGINVHRLVVDTAFLRQAGYLELFDAAFPERSLQDRYTRVTAGLAIAAYERTLLADQAPFQRYLRGNRQALTDLEKQGAILFFGKAGCVSCHTGPALSSMDFYALGMEDLNRCTEPTFKTPASDPAHLGRGGFTNRPEDMFKFKVPQLYNLADSPFYGHGAGFRNIREVVEYKNLAIPQRSDIPVSQLARDFVPLQLTGDEVDAITAFLENSLRDPALDRYQPDGILSGQCFPVNDPLSKEDLGCN